MDDDSATERPHHVPLHQRDCARTSVAILAGWVLTWLTLLPYILIRPPKSGIGWLLQKLSGSWGKRRPVLEFLKAGLFVLTGLVIVVIVGALLVTR